MWISLHSRGHEVYFTPLPSIFNISFPTSDEKLIHPEQLSIFEYVYKIFFWTPLNRIHAFHNGQKVIIFITKRISSTEHGDLKRDCGYTRTEILSASKEKTESIFVDKFGILRKPVTTLINN